MKYNTSLNTSSNTLIPEGTHEATIKAANEREVRGDSKLVVELVILTDTLDQLEKTEFITPTLSDKDSWRVFSDLVALTGSEPKAGDFNEKDLEGMKCMVTYKHIQATNGNTYSNIMKVEPVKKNTN